MTAPARKLSAYTAGRDNNFNLIRVVAALAVLVSHAYPMALGEGVTEPLKSSVGHSLGTLAVYAFFILSGFLIATSFMRASTRTGFVLARVLRLMPGLAVSLIAVMALMGPVVSTLEASAYFTAPQTWTFLLRNLSLFLPQYTLPGVFESNPHPIVEGSIWTLFYEVACYGGVFLVGVLGLLRRPLAFSALAVAYVAGWVALDMLAVALPYQVDKLYTLSVPFITGMLFFLWQDKITLSPWAGLGLVGLAVALRQTPVYDIALFAAMGYGLFWLAYVPSGVLRAYNRLGDYSYGIYIYAIPAQGLAVWLFGPQSPVENMLFSLPLTLIPSVLSWHLVENPALKARKPLAARLTRRAPLPVR